ncbi:MAG: O-antigen ligase family protein [Candidatus Omnitrophota bacterium]
MLKAKLIKYCNRVTEFSLYALAFYVPVSTALIESFAGLAITAWLVKKIASGEGMSSLLRNNFLSLPVLFYVLICIVSSFFSSNPAISFRHFVFKTLEYALIFFIAAEIIDAKFLRNILVVLTISVSLVGIDGLFQHFTNFDFFRGRGQVIIGRINGPFTTPTDFACYVVSLFPLVASFSFASFKKKWIRWMLIIMSAVLFICLILAATRSAWVAVLLVIPFAGVFLGRKRTLTGIALLAVFILLFLPLRPHMAKERISALFTKDKRIVLLCDRPYLLGTGYNMFIDAPVLGQGLGTFMYNFNRFKPAPKSYAVEVGISYAHNCLLQIAAETGLMGLASFLLIIAVLFAVSLRLLRRINKEGFYYYGFCGLNIGIFTYLVSSLFDTNLYSVPLAALFWLMLGLAVVAKNVVEG